MQVGKRILSLAAILGAYSVGQAGSIDNRNNSSAQYIRSLSRNAASEGGDVAIYNPAGTARLPDGLLLDVSNQTVQKWNEHRLEQAKAAFLSDIVSPFYPSAFAVYKRGPWAGFAAFHFPAGGGDLFYEDGSATVYPIQTNLSAFNPARNAEVSLRSLYYALTLGGAYAVDDRLSVSLAARPLYARTDIKVKASGALPDGASSRLVDHMEEARGVAGILGADFSPMPGLILALRLESQTPLEWEVARSTLNLKPVLKDSALRTGYEANLRSQVRAQGQTFNRDLPANLGLGAAYQVLPALRTDLSFNYYFNTLAGWDGFEDRVDDGWEVSLSGEYAWTIPLVTSLGAQYTATGAGPDTYQVENPALNSYSLAAGGRYGFGHGVAVNFGVTGNFALEDDGQAPSLGTAELRKQVWVYALGVQYQVF